MIHRVVRIIGVMALAAAASVGCSDSSSPDPEPATVAVSQGPIVVTSDAFGDGAAIPVTYTCDGAGTSPPLRWTGVPAKAKALALVVADPDAPGGTFYHWVVTDIPVSTHGVAAATTPEGGVVAANSAGDAAYTGPCPPSGTHHYRFYVFALKRLVGLDPGADALQAVDAANAAAISGGTLVGTYTRS